MTRFESVIGTLNIALSLSSTWEKEECLIFSQSGSSVCGEEEDTIGQTGFRPMVFRIQINSLVVKDVVIQLVQKKVDEKDNVILPRSEVPTSAMDDTVSHKAQHNVVLRTLEVAQKKQHDVILTAPNDVISSD